MTQHWEDIKNADVIMIIGSNTAENHPMGFKWITEAMNNPNRGVNGHQGAILINVDPRFNRSSSKAHIYARMRSGTDIAFIGGIINYALENKLYNEKYVRECTNALFKIDPNFKTATDLDGVFSGLTGGDVDPVIGALVNAKYDKSTWQYQKDAEGRPILADSLDDPECAFGLLKRHFSRYTIDKVCAITGTDPEVYQKICETYCATHPDEKSGTIMYAMGTTQHTYGTQNIRGYAILQLLMGNIGVAGGGINALRGQDNVQGSTDMCILQHILPGYLICPTDKHTDLSTYIEKTGGVSSGRGADLDPVHDYTVRGVEHVNPTSARWWGTYKGTINTSRYMVSLLKAWWPTVDHNTSYQYLPKRKSGVDYSMLSIFDDMLKGKIKGFICDGENPAVSDPDSLAVRAALEKLDWMVSIDPFENETAAFWKRPGVSPENIKTAVYLLPCAVAYEKAGSKSNSSRWAQWLFKAGDPPGEALDDLEIITRLGKKLQELYSGGGTCPEPITMLNWPYFNYAGEHADPVKTAKEVNGYYLDGSGNPGKLVASFTKLANDGSTCSGNWLYCNQFVEEEDLDSFEKAHLDIFAGDIGNRMARRYPIDVGKGGFDETQGYKNIGLHYYWSWCWPVNRRIIYNRASTYQSDYPEKGKLAGDPIAPDKFVIRWNETKGTWEGDMPDGGWKPGEYYPFIMQAEGHAHIFGPGRADGPFPEHYEPIESPVDNLMGSYRVNPIVHRYEGSLYAKHGGKYKIAATTYRLTEHWHTGAMSRNLPWPCELQPEPFVEMSEELAAEKGINNGDYVIVSSARGSITLKACVTKRFKPFNINGTKVHQVGIIWHWGYQGLSTGPSGNVLVPHIGDANTRIQESKAFLVDIKKA